MKVARYCVFPAVDEPAFVHLKECVECRADTLDGVEIRIGYYSMFLCDACAEQLINYMEVFHGNITGKHGKIRGDHAAAIG